MTTTAAPHRHAEVPGPVLVRRALRATMGGRGEVRVVAEPADAEWLADVGVARLDALEDRWSRFDPDSDVSRLNRGDGRWTAVAPETAALVQLALDASVATGGAFDPTIAAALEAAGYDRTFGQVVDGAGAALETRAAPGATAVAVDARSHRVRLSAAARLDLGGIGKGHAADLVAAELVELGALGVSIDLGGDVAVLGRPPAGDRWLVSVADALDPDDPSLDVATIGLTTGGVATSTTLGRRWRGPDGGARHHLIDPRTGAPCETGLVAATVVAAQASWAEVYAKAVLVAGPDDGTDLIERAGLAALVTDASGTTWPIGPIEHHLQQRRTIP